MTVLGAVCESATTKERPAVLRRALVECCSSECVDLPQAGFMVNSFEWTAICPVPALQSPGCGNAYFHGPLAQLAEHSTLNRQVPGSIPGGSTKSLFRLRSHTNPLSLQAFSALAWRLVCAMRAVSCLTWRSSPRPADARVSRGTRSSRRSRWSGPSCLPWTSRNPHSR